MNKGTKIGAKNEALKNLYLGIENEMISITQSFIINSVITYPIYAAQVLTSK